MTALDCMQSLHHSHQGASQNDQYFKQHTSNFKKMKTCLLSQLHLPAKFYESPSPPPCTKSLAHFTYVSKTKLFVSLDIEKSGECCGIVQLSAEMFDILDSDETKSHCYLSLGHLQRVH